MGGVSDSRLVALSDGSVCADWFRLLCGALWWLREFCLWLCCRNGLVLLNKRVHAALAAVNRDAGSDDIFDCWGGTLNVHMEILVKV